MAPFRIIIADTSSSFLEHTAAFLSGKTDIEVIACCKSGSDLLTKLNCFSPDLVIMNIVLEDMDGISVLKHCGNMTQRIPFIICTEFFNEITISLTHRFGAAGYLCKPVRMDTLYDTICECLTCLSSIASTSAADARYTETLIAEHLAHVGIPASCSGYSLLISAAKSVLHEPALLNSLSSRLYPAVARRHNTTSGNVERNIRSAIRSAYKRNSLSGTVPIPTNKQLIIELVREAKGSLSII